MLVLDVLFEVLSVVVLPVVVLLVEVGLRVSVLLLSLLLSERRFNAPISKFAVPVESVFGLKATVFDVSWANVIPPTKALTAPMVPTARTIGLILRKCSISISSSLYLTHGIV